MNKEGLTAIITRQLMCALDFVNDNYPPVKLAARLTVTDCWKILYGEKPTGLW